MKAKLTLNKKEYAVDLGHPMDLSISMSTNASQTSAWYVDDLKIEPVRSDKFVGSVKEGGSVNFRNIWFNPHGHGTHTECLGHITPEVFSINQSVKSYFSVAQLITVTPRSGTNDPKFSHPYDKIISLEMLQAKLSDELPEALIIRTRPNTSEKKTRKWSGFNWPQLDHKAAAWMADSNIKHLLIDLPSVDREQDGGKLLSHHAFWRVPEKPRLAATITELIYVDDSISDGNYLLELQFAPFENDASPSRPVLYSLKDV